MIKQAQYAKDPRPIDSDCGCPVCRKFSRAYLRHLFVANEMLGVRLNTIHNLWYYGSLMQGMRQAIREDRFAEFQNEFYRRHLPETTTGKALGGKKWWGKESDNCIVE